MLDLSEIRDNEQVSIEPNNLEIIGELSQWTRFGKMDEEGTEIQ